MSASTGVFHVFQIRQPLKLIINKIKLLIRQITIGLFLFMGGYPAFAQKVVEIRDSEPQHIFTYAEIETLEDRIGNLTIENVTRAPYSLRFAPSAISNPKIRDFNSAYWFRIKIKDAPQSNYHWLLEFFDQTIDHIDFYQPTSNGSYIKHTFGDSFKFAQREYYHKNFTFSLDNSSGVEKVFYFRVKSSQSASIIVVLRNTRRFVEYASFEYLFFGLFYGMILVFGFYNLLMYLAIRQKQYLYYVLYNLSIGFYEMCIDGIAFQFFWPNYPSLNPYGYGVALYLSSVFGLLFTTSFLYLRSKKPVLFNLILSVICLRTVFFIICLFDPQLFTYKMVDVVPLIVALSSGIYIWNKGYRPARFFVIGYSFLLFGVLIKILVLMNVSWMYYGPITYYSLGICFVAEMILVSFAIGDNVRHLRKKKDRAQQRMIHHLQINEKLKDTLNKELTSLVDERTRDVVEKAEIIEKQNEELNKINNILKEQAAEISRMNVLLEKDNQELTVNIEKVTRARVMSQEVNFEEFSKIYPDRETCFKYLAGLKWENGYSCKKCGNTHYLAGHLPYSRRCSKCRYEESVIANTIFQNSRIPINKAFYMLFLIYSSKGKISSHKLSEILSIRQSTCWSYSSKMKKVLEERKKDLKNAGEKGWSKMVLDNDVS